MKKRINSCHADGNEIADKKSFYVTFRMLFQLKYMCCMWMWRCEEMTCYKFYL